MLHTFITQLLLCHLILITLTESCSIDCDYCLQQQDFADGTYRIKTANKKYCLSEDIVFDPLPPLTNTSPNTPFDSCFPTNEHNFPGCTALAGGSFALGFFAAITIEADNIELDLSDYKISMDQSFYIQQRSFTIIEIGSAPFIADQGPADFGENKVVKNVYVHDGVLGLSSHSGIHSNDAQNITIENLRICDFETTGIQFNGFTNLKMNNLIIGPSSTQVKPCGYYSNGKFLSLALYKIIESGADLDTENYSLTFNGGRSKSITEIYNDLITSLDIAYRSFLGETTEEDKNHELYDISIDLYTNPMEISDGSSMYGILLNSRGVGVGGFGESQNKIGNGENVQMSNIKISDLKLNVNEIPAVYFDKCIDPLDEETKTILTGPFADVMDVRRMVGEYVNGQVIDLGDDFTQLCYVGNPLSDAQIALGIFGGKFEADYRVSGMNSEFLKWALEEYEGESYATLPSCTSFICNGDIMFHTNKGIIGVRMDGIENAVVENIVIKKLMNKSPLASYACANYSGPHDGGTPSNQEEEGGMGTDVKGIAITGGDVLFDGYNNVIQKLVSYNGDVIGLNLKQDAQVEFDYVFKDELPQKDDNGDTEDDRSAIHIKQLAPGHEITFGLLAELIVDEKYPYPNNFYACNIKIEDKIKSEMTPYPPNGVDKIWCADYVPDDKDEVIRKILPVDVKIDGDVVVEEAKTTTEIPGMSVELRANINSKKMVDILSKNNKNDMDVIDKYPNTPYIYFVIGLICIIMVVFVLVTFIMKCGKIMMINDGKYQKAYAKASFDDSDDDLSDLTDDEDDLQI